jgi:hypothetical protein
MILSLFIFIDLKIFSRDSYFNLVGGEADEFRENSAV